MKAYLKFFKVPLLVVLVLSVIGIGCKVVSYKRVTEGYVRKNTQCLTKERVFDYAEKLTEKEEEKLREKIAKAEKFCGCDIVIVTLDESLEEYAKSYEDKVGVVEPYQYTMVFADNFYDENKFGYNAPYGDGTILLDNWYREADGRIYSWMSTTGKVQEAYSSQMIDETLDICMENVDEDPAYAYGRFVELVAAQMGPYDPELSTVGSAASWAIGLVAALIFYLVNHGGRRGKKTVTSSTYVQGGRPEFRDKQDIFITKTVTRRRIQTSSSGSGFSGGGGSHRSAGGHSHGGGGHSR